MPKLMIRIALLPFIGLLLSFVTPPRQQQDGPTERAPNYSMSALESVYPRWLTYTRVHPMLVQSSAPPANQNPLVSVGGVPAPTLEPSLAVDSRGVVHMVDWINPGPNGMVTYYNTRPDTRQSNGFSAATVLFMSSATDYVTGWPDLWVDNLDNVHVCWTVARDRSTPTQQLIGSDVVYRVLMTQGGWNPILSNPPTNLTNAVITPARVDMYFYPQIVTDASNNYHIPCVFTRSDIPTSDLIDLTNGTRQNIPDTQGNTQIIPVFPWRVAVGKSPMSSNTIHLIGLCNTGPTTWSRTNGVWSQPSAVGLPAGAGQPDIAVDSVGMAHYVYPAPVPGSNPPITAVYYQDGTRISVANVAPWARILMDSRDQIHALYFAELSIDPLGSSSQLSYQLAYGARVRNPSPTSLSVDWRLQEPIAAPLMDYYRGTVPTPNFPPPQQGPNVRPMVAPGLEVFMTADDTIHAVDGNCTYTRTMEYGMGCRDSQALVPAMPNGAVDITSGNFHFNLGLYSTRGISPSQSLSLVYNSLETNASSITPGWKLSLESHLIDHYLAINSTAAEYLDEPYEAITVFMPDGRPIHFRFRTFGPGPNGAYLTAEDEFGFFAKLQRTSFASFAPEYVLTFKSGDVWTYNSTGRLREIREATGKCIDFVYSNGLVTSIRDQKETGAGGGRTATLSYESNDPVHCPRIASIVDPGQKTYTLTYDGRYLVSMRFTSGPSQPTWRFQYGETHNAAEGRRIHLIRRIAPPRGGENYGYTCRYLQDNRITEVEDPAGPILSEFVSDGAMPQTFAPRIRFRYVEPPMAAAQHDAYLTTKRVDSGAEYIEYRFVFDRRRGLVQELHDPYSGSGGIGFLGRTFNDYGLLTGVTDRYGCETSYQYFAPSPMTLHVRDNLDSVQRTNPSGGGLMTVAEYDYAISETFTRLFQVTTQARSAGESSPTSRVTSYQYDNAGRVTVITHPSVTRPDGITQSATTEYEYDVTTGALSKVTDEEGHAITFLTFHATGLPLTSLRDGGTQVEVMTYDAMGNQLSHTAPVGGSSNDTPGTSFVVLDGMYRVSTSTDAAGRTTTYGYDVDSNCTSVQPPAGSPTTTAYDNRGFASGGSTPDGNWTQCVDEEGLLERTTDYRDLSTNYDYDSLGRMIQTRTPGGSSGGGGGGPSTHITSWVHDILGAGPRQSTVTQIGAASRTTTMSHDLWGRVTSTLQPDAATRIDTTFNELGEVVATSTYLDTTLQQCVVSFLDHRGRHAGSRIQNMPFSFGGSAPSGSQSSWSLLDRSGSVVMSVGPRGDVADSNSLVDKIAYVHDARGRVTQVQQPVDGTMTTVQETDYGDDDLAIESRVPNPVNPLQMVTHRKLAYTARKELKSSLNADNQGTTYAYTLLPGQIDTSTDAAGTITKTTYYSDTQRPWELIEGYGTGIETRTASVWQNGFLSQTQVFDPQAGTFTAAFQRQYDQAGRPERLTAPQVQPEVLTYNDFGELVEHASGSATATHQYSSLGKRTDTSWSGAYSNQVAHGYDGQGNLTLLDDGILRKEWTYDPESGLPVSERFFLAGNLWRSHAYEYDASGNLTQMTDAESNVHAWVYDDANRVVGIRYAGIDVCSLAYTRGGLLALTTLRNSAGSPIAQTAYSYDSKGRRERAHTTRTGNGATLSDLRWEYDIRNRVTKIKYYHLGIESEIGYNFKGEVTSEVTTGNGGGAVPPPFNNQFGGAPTGNVSTPSDQVEATPGGMMVVPNRSASYSYDRGGNRISQTIDGVTTTLTYNSASQLVTESRSGFNVTHTYDGWGNETERTTSEGGNTTVETFGYNYLNRMSTYVRTVNSSVTAQWSYQFWASGERAGKTNLATNAGELYVTQGDNVVTEYTRSSQGAISLANSYAQGLGLDQKSLRIPTSGGRIHYLGDLVGTVTTTVTDSALKSEECVRDTWGMSLAGDTNNERYGFSQRECDAESGLVFMRHRIYDSRLGRFSQRDPIGDQRHLTHYRYAANRPNQLYDPTGLQDDDPTENQSDGDDFDPNFDYEAYKTDLENHGSLYRAFWNFFGAYTKIPDPMKDPVGWQEARVKQFQAAAGAVGDVLNAAAQGVILVGETAATGALGGVVLKIGGKLFTFARKAMYTRRIAAALKSTGLVGHTFERHGGLVSDGYLWLRLFKGWTKAKRSTRFLDDGEALWAISKVITKPENLKKIRDAAGGHVILVENFGKVMGQGFKRVGGKIVAIKDTVRRVVVRIENNVVYSAYPTE